MTRVTLPERIFALPQPVAVDDFLATHRWAVVCKAGSSDKTIDAWQVVQNALEARADIAVGVEPLKERATRLLQHLEGAAA
jgi:hypothetical protein